MKLRLKNLLTGLLCLSTASVVLPFSSCSDLFPKQIKIFAPKTISHASIVTDGTATVSFVGFTFENIEEKNKLSVTANFSSGVAQFIPEIINFNKTTKTFDIKLNILNIGLVTINGDFSFMYNGKPVNFISSKPFTIDLYKQKMFTDPNDGTSAQAIISHGSTPTSVTFKNFSYDELGDSDYGFIGIKNDAFESMEPTYRVTNFNIKNKTFDITIEFNRPRIGVFDGSFSFFYKENLVDHQNVQIFHLELFYDVEIEEPDIGTKQVWASDCHGEWIIPGFKYKENLNPALLDVENTIAQDAHAGQTPVFETKIINISPISKTFDVLVSTSNCEGGNAVGHLIYKYDGKTMFESGQNFTLFIKNPIPERYMTISKVQSSLFQQYLTTINTFSKSILTQNIAFNNLTIPASIEFLGPKILNDTEWLTNNDLNSVFIDFSCCNNIMGLDPGCFQGAKSIAGDIVFPSTLTNFGANAFSLHSTDSQHLSSLLFDTEHPVTMDTAAFSNLIIENGLILPGSILERQTLDVYGSEFFADSKFGYIDMTKFQQIPSLSSETPGWFKNCLPYKGEKGKLYLNKTQEPQIEAWNVFLRNKLLLSEEFWDIEFIEK